MNARRFYLGMAIASAITMCTATGCERKERVLDIKTPNAEVKVDRNVDTGAVEVQTDKK